MSDNDERNSATPNGNEQDSATGVETRSPDGPGRAESPDEVRRQRDEYLDQLQRSRAEFSNFQKRIRAQMEADRTYAAADLARDLLPVLDNFERAMDAARAAGASSIVEGIDLVYKQLLEVLGKHGVQPIPAVGQPFDPNRHEALMQQPSHEHPEGTVVNELGKGYIHKDRVLRPSKVAVSIKPQS